MDEAFEILFLILAAGAVLFGPLILSIAAIRRTGRLRDQIELLTAKVQALEARLMAAPPPMPEAAPPEAAPIVPEPEPAVTIAPAAPAEPPPVEEVMAPAAAAAAMAPQPTVAARQTLEERLTLRWAVWLGAITLILGGVFLVKYSIDQGWLGPELRVLLGVLLGFALIVAAHRTWQRLTAAEDEEEPRPPGYVPVALAGAGLAILFASIYAAYELYALLPPLIAFALLAVVSAGAVLLSFWFGPAIAFLGLTAAFVVPMLIQTTAPAAFGLFSYLVFVVAACLYVAHARSWAWPAWLALVASTLWTLLWFVDLWRSGDGWAIGIYTVLVARMFPAIMPWPSASQEPEGEAPATPSTPSQLSWVAWSGLGVAALLIFILVRMDSYGPAALSIWGAFAAIMLILGWRDPRFDRAPWIAAAMTVLLVAAWHLPQIMPPDLPMGVVEGSPTGYVPGPIIAPELSSFVSVAAATAALFGLGGLAVLFVAPHPGRWAGMSVATPIALLAAAYWRVEDFDLALPWAAASLALAAFNLVVSERLMRQQIMPGINAARAAFAIGVIAAISLAMGMTFRTAWLTVALSLQLPAIAWVHARLAVPALRSVALVVAAVVIARLVFNDQIVEYPIGTTPLLNWLIYGYGIPMLAFLEAARRFRPSADDMLVATLEAGAIAFGVVLVSLEIRHIANDGQLRATDYGLLEQSLHSLSWLAIGFGLMVLDRYYRRAVLGWGWRLLGGAGAVQVIFLQVLGSNPLDTGEPVGSLPLANLLTLAYGLPAAMGVLFWREATRQQLRPVAAFAGTAALGLILVDVTLEVTRAFRGSVLTAGEPSDAEWYAYSAVWLVYGAIMMALALRTGAAALRYASLAIVALTVLKVFLFDMAELTGLLRAVSFLGLGASLIGIGYFYQRYVFPPRRAEPGDGAG